jgi:hypothetical protein
MAWVIVLSHEHGQNDRLKYGCYGNRLPNMTIFYHIQILNKGEI